jgi:hypothetical protein
VGEAKSSSSGWPSVIRQASLPGMSNTIRCDQCGIVNDEKPTIIRFSYHLVDGTPGVELFYFCSSCNCMLPRTNPVRRSQLVQFFISLYPNKKIKLE